jgi:hypothetical protein
MKRILIKAANIFLLIGSLTMLIVLIYAWVTRGIPLYAPKMFGAVIGCCVGILISIVSLSIERDTFEIKPKDIEHSIDKSVLLAFGSFGFAIIGILIFLYDDRGNVIVTKIMCLFGIVYFIYGGIRYLKDKPKDNEKEIIQSSEVESSKPSTGIKKNILKGLGFVGCAILFFMFFVIDNNGPWKIGYIVGFIGCLWEGIKLMTVNRSRTKM